MEKVLNFGLLLEDTKFQKKTMYRGVFNRYDNTATETNLLENEIGRVENLKLFYILILG